MQLNNGSLSESEVKEDDDHETTGSVNQKDESMLCDKENIRRKKKKKRKKSGKVLSSHTRSSEDNVEVPKSVTDNMIIYLIVYLSKHDNFFSFRMK